MPTFLYRTIQYLLKQLIVLTVKYKVTEKLYNWASKTFMDCIMKEIGELHKKFEEQERVAEEIRQKTIKLQEKK